MSIVSLQPAKSSDAVASKKSGMQLDPLVPDESPKSADMSSPISIYSSFSQKKVLTPMSPMSQRRGSVVNQMVQEVLKAVKKRDIHGLRRILMDKKNRAHINVLDRHGASPLFYAIWNGYLEIARELLEAGADPNMRLARPAVSTVVQVPLETGDTESLKLLSMYGGEMKPVAPKRDSALPNDLLQAVKSRDIELVRELLKQLPESRKDAAQILNQTDSAGWTLVHYAAFHGSSDIIEMLGKAGASMSQHAMFEGKSCTPLEIAFERQFFQTALVLKEKYQCQSAIMLEEIKEKVAVSNKMEQLRNGIVSGDFQFVSSLLDSDGGDMVNLTLGDHRKVSPLEMAVIFENHDMCRVLLERGANVHAKDDTEHSALDVAIEHGNHAMIALLCEHLDEHPIEAIITRICERSCSTQSGLDALIELLRTSSRDTVKEMDVNQIVCLLQRLAPNQVELATRVLEVCLEEKMKNPRRFSLNDLVGQYKVEPKPAGEALLCKSESFSVSPVEVSDGGMLQTVELEPSEKCLSQEERLHLLWILEDVDMKPVPINANGTVRGKKKRRDETDLEWISTQNPFLKVNWKLVQLPIESCEDLDDKRSMHRDQVGTSSTSQLESAGNRRGTANSTKEYKSVGIRRQSVTTTSTPQLRRGSAAQIIADAASSKLLPFVSRVSRNSKRSSLPLMVEKKDSTVTKSVQTQAARMAVVEQAAWMSAWESLAAKEGRAAVREFMDKYTVKRRNSKNKSRASSPQSQSPPPAAAGRYIKVK